jgi:N-succinyldiaminopimelate aminotransferase
MNSNLNKLQPYPFQKLRQLFEGIAPNPAYDRIDLHIGEPKHVTPDFIRQAIVNNLDLVSSYPTTLGVAPLRKSIAAWLMKRYRLPALHPDTEVIPVSGSREALFSFAQAVVDSSLSNPVVVCPNPFYQIYEGAALLAGAVPNFINILPANNFELDFSQLTDEIWSRTQLIYVCSPGNPTGRVMSMGEWRQLFALSDRYGFVIASDECYSEIYFDETKPPLGALEAAHFLGRNGFPRLVVFGSLSKRSNAPGIRSGFVAGDAEILKKYLLYRTYHGCTMNPAIQAASAAAWSDELHVAENRRQYREKFSKAMLLLEGTMPVTMPDAAFYFWARTPISDLEFTKQLHRDYNVTVLPGSFLARNVRGINPGENFVRIALVAPITACMEAIDRIKSLVTSQI